MDTVVRDPFFHVLPQQVGLSVEELFALLSAEAWVQFETGKIDESTFARRLFAKSPPAGVTRERLQQAIADNYTFVPGMEPLLKEIKARGLSLWILSNYPPWVERIRRQLGLDRYFDGYVVSYQTGVRKPDPRAYRALLRQSGVDAAHSLFVDDRQENIDGARRCGMQSLLFEGTPALRQQLERLQLL